LCGRGVASVCHVVGCTTAVADSYCDGAAAEDVARMGDVDGLRSGRNWLRRAA